MKISIFIMSTLLAALTIMVIVMMFHCVKNEMQISEYEPDTFTIYDAFVLRFDNYPDALITVRKDRVCAEMITGNTDEWYINVVEYCKHSNGLTIMHGGHFIRDGNEAHEYFYPVVEKVNETANYHFE